MSEQEKLAIDKGMLDLFCAELQSQISILNNGIVALEKQQLTADVLQNMMRAAHSLKGSSRVLGMDSLVTLAHALEDYFVALQQGKVASADKHADILLHAVDLIAQLGSISHDKIGEWLHANSGLLGVSVKNIKDLISGNPVEKQVVAAPVEAEPEAAPEKDDKQDRVLRVTAQNLSRLMGLAGESMVESRWLAPFSETLIRLKKNISSLSSQVETMRETLKDTHADITTEKEFHRMQDATNTCLSDITNRIAELDLFISRHSSLTDRLYSEVIDSRMRPFSDGIVGFPRMVRDLAKQLGKQARLEIRGANTPVDRDILDKLEAPLTHLIRNAIDHGIEQPLEREAKGKPREGTILLSAEHRGGMLAISVSDDGRGVDLEYLRKRIVEKGLAKSEFAAKLSQQELLDFLFLPGFSTQDKTTEISGRGMGLNIVQNMLQEVSGSIRIIDEVGKGISFNMHLPLTLSVIRALTVEIAGEPYAFPLARIERSLLVPIDQVQAVENRQYFNFENLNIGLVSAAEVLEVSNHQSNESVLPVVVLRDRHNAYGLVVDSFLGERELVLQDLETRLGKIPNISAGAFMEDGSPALIIDIDDIINSIDNLLTGGRLHQLEYKHQTTVEQKQKRVLVVDDSITVREVQSRLLHNHGYDVETAVNGMDGWNAVRMSRYDLIITDVDMPRMNGIELLQMIRSDPTVKEIPVMIVSYKEREEDREQGMKAGANYYMTKSSFHDETLVDVVEQLIGKPI